MFFFFSLSHLSYCSNFFHPKKKSPNSLSACLFPSTALFFSSIHPNFCGVLCTEVLHFCSTHFLPDPPAPGFHPCLLKLPHHGHQQLLWSDLWGALLSILLSVLVLLDHSTAFDLLASPLLWNLLLLVFTTPFSIDPPSTSLIILQSPFQAPFPQASAFNSDLYYSLLSFRLLCVWLC